MHSRTHSHTIYARPNDRPRAAQSAYTRPPRTRPRARCTYCDIGVYFVLLPIFTDESAAELVHARRHYLKPLMALGEDGFERFDFLLEGVQTSHLRCDVRAVRRVYGGHRRRLFTPSERDTDEITVVTETR